MAVPGAGFLPQRVRVLQRPQTRAGFAEPGLRRAAGGPSPQEWPPRHERAALPRCLSREGASSGFSACGSCLAAARASSPAGSAPAPAAAEGSPSAGLALAALSPATLLRQRAFSLGRVFGRCWVDPAPRPYADPAACSVRWAAASGLLLQRRGEKHKKHTPNAGGQRGAYRAWLWAAPPRPQLRSLGVPDGGYDVSELGSASSRFTQNLC